MIWTGSSDSEPLPFIRFPSAILSLQEDGKGMFETVFQRLVVLQIVLVKDHFNDGPDVGIVEDLVGMGRDNQSLFRDPDNSVLGILEEHKVAGAEIKLALGAVDKCLRDAGSNELEAVSLILGVSHIQGLVLDHHVGEDGGHGCGKRVSTKDYLVAIEVSKVLADLGQNLCNDRHHLLRLAMEAIVNGDASDPAHAAIKVLFLVLFLHQHESGNDNVDRLGGGDMDETKVASLGASITRILVSHSERVALDGFLVGRSSLKLFRKNVAQMMQMRLHGLLGKLQGCWKGRILVDSNDRVD